MQEPRPRLGGSVYDIGPGEVVHAVRCEGGRGRAWPCGALASPRTAAGLGESARLPVGCRGWSWRLSVSRWSGARLTFEPLEGLLEQRQASASRPASSVGLRRGRSICGQCIEVVGSQLRALSPLSTSSCRGRASPCRPASRRPTRELSMATSVSGWSGPGAWPCSPLSPFRSEQGQGLGQPAGGLVGHGEVIHRHQRVGVVGPQLGLEPLERLLNSGTASAEPAGVLVCHSEVVHRMSVSGCVGAQPVLPQPERLLVAAAGPRPAGPRP